MLELFLIFASILAILLTPTVATLWIIWIINSELKPTQPTMNIRLIGDRLIVRPIPREKIGVIELPESLHDSHINGPKVYWVMLVGPGRRNKKGKVIPMEVEFGDRVICQSYTKGADEFKNPYGDLMITADQILLVLPKEPSGLGYKLHPMMEVRDGPVEEVTINGQQKNEKG